MKTFAHTLNKGRFDYQPVVARGQLSSDVLLNVLQRFARGKRPLPPLPRLGR